MKLGDSWEQPLGQGRPTIKIEHVAGKKYKMTPDPFAWANSDEFWNIMSERKKNPSLNLVKDVNKNKSRVSALSPREIVSELDRYVIGQKDAKKAVAVALRNRWRRQALSD